MPLKTLRISSTRVTDLSPLAGMPLTDLDASSSPASDYSPLAGAPLERCILGRSGVSDLSFLRGSPVRELSLNLCEAVRGFAVLGGLKSLELLVLPNFRAFPDQEFAAIGALRAHATLKTIGEGRWTTSQIFQTTQSKDAFWKDWDREQAFVPALRKSGFSFSISKLSAGSYSLEVRDPALSDLSFLKGAPISELRLDGCKVTDLAPLRDLPLRSLGLSGNPVADLSPLRGMRLERLNLAATKVSDLSPIAGLPLTELYLDACENLTDVSALAEIPTLEKLTVPINARNIEMLRKLPKLQMLAFQLAGKSPYIPTSTTEQFWKMWPGMAWARALNEAGMKYTASQDSEGWWTVTVESKEFSDCSIFKSAPIRELVLYGTSVADLRPLEGFALTRLDIRQTLVTDLTALRAPALSGSLRDLRLYDTKVTDFSPLTACTNLEVLDASSTALADLSLLRGRKLRSIQLIRTKVTDISVLAGMPLTRVTLADTAVSDLRPLLQCPTLNELVLPVGARDVKALRALPALTAISYDYKTGGVATQKAAEFWKEFEQQGWMRALRELGLKEPTLKQPEHLKQLPDGTWDVRLDGTVLSDLTILRGAPISRLDFGNTAVSDLTPLRGMTLKRLSLYNTKVSDLSPLQGMPLDRLHLSGTKVTDLSVLRGMPLTLLRLHDCTEASDLSPLVGNTTLKQVTLPPNAKNFEFLRNLPNLERLGFTEDSKTRLPDKTAAEFWQEFDAKK